MSNILKGLNEGRNYGRDSWDSNMPGYQGDYGGAKNFGRRNREWDEDDRIDARIRAEYEKKKEYEQNGTFWLKLKDSQRHLPAGPFKGKQAANTAAIELLKQQPELKGNLVITAYGPDETQGVAEGQLNELSPQTLASYKKKAGADATQADKRGDYSRGNKRMSGIMQATRKEFANDEKKVPEAKYDSGDYYNARQGREYGAKSSQVDSGAYEFEKEVHRNEPGGEHGRPKNLKGVSKSLPADAFGRTTGKIPAGKTGRIHSMMNDVDEDLDENLHKWFKEKWVRFGPDGKIRGDCARGDDSEGKPKCLPQSKAQNLGKKGRASAAARKRREDPNPERSGKAINVNTKKKTNEEQLDELSCWSGYHRVAGTKAGFPGSCAKNKTNESEHSETCPHCGGEMVSEELMNEKKDACYYKVKSRYKVWPSAYASGALVKCRKKGADSWGNGGKKNEGVAEDDAGDVEQRMIAKIEKEKQRLAKLKQTDPEAYKREMEKRKTSSRVPPVSTFEDQGVAEEQLDEKWTKKYKDSINCSNPKGFSQKAHCAGKQKNESAIMKGLK